MGKLQCCSSIYEEINTIKIPLKNKNKKKKIPICKTYFHAVHELWQFCTWGRLCKVIVWLLWGGTFFLHGRRRLVLKDTYTCIKNSSWPASWRTLHQKCRVPYMKVHPHDPILNIQFDKASEWKFQCWDAIIFSMLTSATCASACYPRMLSECKLL